MTALRNDSLRDLLRPSQDAAIAEMVREARRHIPEYVAGSQADRALQQRVATTVAHFIDSLGHDEPDWLPLTELYARIGEDMARAGESLDRLQTALRLSSQVACRRFIKDAYRFGWPQETVTALTDSLFALVAKAADAAAQGYAEQRGRQAGRIESARAALRDALVAAPSPGLKALTQHADAAHWTMPRTVAVVAVSPEPDGARPILPPDLLADWDASYVVVPHPDAPDRADRLAPVTGAFRVAIGPTVPVTEGATSLRWARHALRLIERGVLPAGASCADHVATLAAFLAEDLIEATAEDVLGGLLAVRPDWADELLQTLLAYLQSGNSAVVAAGRLHVHPQTVRYRLRRIRELAGDRIDDPERYQQLITVVHWLVRTRTGRRTDAP